MKAPQYGEGSQPKVKRTYPTAVEQGGWEEQHVGTLQRRCADPTLPFSRWPQLPSRHRRASAAQPLFTIVCGRQPLTPPQSTSRHCRPSLPTAAADK